MTDYDFVKALPINYPVLTNQINADVTIGVLATSMSYDGGTSTLTVTMASSLTGPQLAELTTVVANHNGITKDFEVDFPPLFDDFISAANSSTLGWVVSPVNAGAVTNGNAADTDHPGVVQLGTGVLATGGVGYHLGLSDIRLGGGALNMEFMIKIPTLSAAPNTYAFRVGLGDNPVAKANNGIYIEYDTRTSPKWSVVAVTAGTSTLLTSGVVVDTGWHIFSLVVDAAGANVNFFVDDTFIETVSANIPTATNCGPIVQLVKLTGTTPVNVSMDYFYLFKTTGRLTV